MRNKVLDQIVENLLKQLRELETTHSDWKWNFDVHSREIAESVDLVIKTKPSELEKLEDTIRNPGHSIRAVIDSVISIACWIYINDDADARRRLAASLEPWGHISPLLANLSCRFHLKFRESGDIDYARFSLAAIALLGNNLDPREEPNFVRQIERSLVERGHDPIPILQEFLATSSGKPEELFEEAITRFKQQIDREK